MTNAEHCEDCNTTGTKYRRAGGPGATSTSLEGHLAGSEIGWVSNHVSLILQFQLLPIPEQAKPRCRCCPNTAQLTETSPACQSSQQTLPGRGSCSPSTFPPLAKAGMIPSCPSTAPSCRLWGVCGHSQGFFPLSRTFRIKPGIHQTSPAQHPSVAGGTGFILSRAILSFVTEVEF